MTMLIIIKIDLVTFLKFYISSTCQFSVKKNHFLCCIITEPEASEGGEQMLSANGTSSDLSTQSESPDNIGLDGNTAREEHHLTETSSLTPQEETVHESSESITYFGALGNQ